MKKKYCYLFIIISLISLLLSACGLSRQESARIRMLKQQEKDNFIAQAKVQYGEEAKVHDIYVPTVSVNNSVWPVVTIRSTGQLAGDIITGGEEFYGIYIPEDHQVYSRKNYDRIAESVPDFLGITDLDILDVTIEDSNTSYNMCCLPDDIVTFQQMLESEDSVRTIIYTTSDISGLDQAHFQRLYQSYNQSKNSDSRVVLLQLEDSSVLDDLKKDIDNISFEYDNSESISRVYDSNAKEYVSAFEKYGILSSIYMSCDKYVLN